MASKIKQGLYIYKTKMKHRGFHRKAPLEMKPQVSDKTNNFAFQAELTIIKNYI